MPTYDIEVSLIGTDGNAYALIGKVGNAIRRAEGDEAAERFKTEAKSKESYDELLTFIMITVEVT